MIAIIHPNWESDIVLEEGDLENLILGNTLSGDMADYPKLGKVFLSVNKNVLSPGYYFNLDWNKNNPDKYSFEIYNEGLEMLKANNYVHGRYENGLNGSKLGIYGDGKDSLTKENIEFAIQMIKLDNKNNS